MFPDLTAILIFAGGVLLPAAVLGLLGGGYIAKKLELKIPGLMKMNIISGCFAIPLAFVFLMKCPTVKLAGIYEPYGNEYVFTKFQYIIMHISVVYI